MSWEKWLFTTFRRDKLNFLKEAFISGRPGLYRDYF